MSDRLRVGVVLGGRSSEREISLESGRNIYYSLDASRFEALAIYMDGAGRLWEIGLPLIVQNTCRDIEDRLAHDGRRIRYEELPERVDVVYIGLHGKYGEDGCFQGLLELLDLPYVGSGVLGSALGMDKRVQRQILRQAGIEVPRTHAVERGEWERARDRVLAEIAASPGYPCVVKPSREGCSTALAVIGVPSGSGAPAGSAEAHGATAGSALPPDAAAALSAAIDEALRWDNVALVEELLAGTEVTVVVLADGAPYAFAPTETPPSGAFLTIEEKFLPGQGVNITPARLPAEVLAAVRRTAERAFEALGLQVFARIDMYVTGDGGTGDGRTGDGRTGDGRIVVGEPNTLPGSSPSSTIFLGPIEEGIGPMDLVTRIIDLSIEAHRQKKGPLG